MSEDNNPQHLLVDTIKTHLKLNYSPNSISPATFYMSTAELTRRLQAFYPCDSMTEALIAQWMQELGFSFKDLGNMQLESRITPI